MYSIPVDLPARQNFGRGREIRHWSSVELVVDQAGVVQCARPDARTTHQLHPRPSSETVPSRCYSLSLHSHLASLATERKHPTDSQHRRSLNLLPPLFPSLTLFNSVKPPATLERRTIREESFPSRSPSSSSSSRDGTSSKLPQRRRRSEPWIGCRRTVEEEVDGLRRFRQLAQPGSQEERQERVQLYLHGRW